MTAPRRVFYDPKSEPRSLRPRPEVLPEHRPMSVGALVGPINEQAELCQGGIVAAHDAKHSGVRDYWLKWAKAYGENKGVRRP